MVGSHSVKSRNTMNDPSLQSKLSNEMVMFPSLESGPKVKPPRSHKREREAWSSRRLCVSNVCSKTLRLLEKDTRGNNGLLWDNPLTGVRARSDTHPLRQLGEPATQQEAQTSHRLMSSWCYDGNRERRKTAGVGHVGGRGGETKIETKENRATSEERQNCRRMQETKSEYKQ
jgi:hypothetical protein